MTTIPELIGIYIRGLKQLFYYRPSKEGEKGKLSILKILILVAYIFAYIFTFYQFSESNISEAAILEFRSNGQYIQINSNLDIDGNWTISLWIMIDTRGTSQPIIEISQALSYDVGIVISIVWWVISPILVLSAILLSLDIAAKDYPRLLKSNNRKNIRQVISQPD